VNFPVSIVGEDGAILESSTTGATGIPLVVEAALHIKNANQTRVRNIEFRPSGADAMARLPPGQTRQGTALVHEASDLSGGVGCSKRPKNGGLRLLQYLRLIYFTDILT
jgi:hypothetical protein